MHTILDEIIVGGQVLETSSSEVVKAVDEISRFFPIPHNNASCLYNNLSLLHNNVITSMVQVGEGLKFHHACSKIDLGVARAVECFMALSWYRLCRRPFRGISLGWNVW